MKPCILIQKLWNLQKDVYKRQGEDQLRESGSLPATFYVLTRVKYLILINKVLW